VRQDHGKTSLTDALIATNGIISPKLAGKIRYLDSRPDEQLRGITMESSAISLYFSLLRRSAPEAQPEQKEFLINLIDSPGHIDFSYEVSTASRLCDGAVVLVDAVEGVCSQTVTVLRQTWIEKLKPLLVINKMDRLITELKMSPGEAHTHLSKLLEQVNAVMGSFYQGERMEDDLRWREKMEERLNAIADEKTDTRSSSVLENGDGIDTTSTPAEYEEKDDEDIYFAPEKNNVIFGSAIDGWAFTVRQFASLYEKKLGIKRSILEKVLWGDFYLDPKTKRVLSSKHLKGRHLKPMFVQLVLDNVWAVYEATTGGNNGKGCVDFLSFFACLVYACTLAIYLYFPLQRLCYGREDHQVPQSEPAKTHHAVARPTSAAHGTLRSLASVIDRSLGVRHRIPASTIQSARRAHARDHRQLARCRLCCSRSTRRDDKLQGRQGRSYGSLRQQDDLRAYERAATKQAKRRRPHS
jgi:small GTP-binding protein